MARNMYGATSADFTLTSGGRVVPGATLTIWSARTGGTQITDLLDRDSVATTTVTSDADGSIVYYGPNNDKTVHWADSGVGNRIAIRPVDITGDPPVLSIGTVGTGAAAASLTGTSEAPVLNLTLPSAGANGVNTAAIQDGAVTVAKLGSDVRIGNLLTANQASGTVGSFTAGGGWSIADGGGFVRATASDADGYIEATGTVAVTAGATYTISMNVKMVSAGAAWSPYIVWYTAADAYVGETRALPAWNTARPTSWTLSQGTVVAPATAAKAYIRFTVSYGATASDTFDVDEWGFWKGTGGQWAMPGQPILGLTDAPIGNLLTLNQATGTDAEAATTGFIGSSVTLASSTAQYAQGSRSLAATTTVTTGCGVLLHGDTGGSYMTLPVTPGETYTALASVYSSASEAYSLRIYWWTSANVAASTAYHESASATVTTAWQELRVTATAPSNAAYAVVYARRASGASGTVMYLDKFSFHRGAAGQWSLPGVPVTGQSHIATNGAVHLSGTGSPEGVVTAAPGSTWLQTDATTDVKGWIRWVKATGTGNTGWVAGPEADTGLRNIGSLTANSWTVATVMVARRVGNVVTIDIQGLNGASATNDTFLTAASLAIGVPDLSGTFSAIGHLTNAFNGTTPYGVYYSTGTVGFAAARASITGGWGRLTYVTDSGWPSSLPGSAA